MKEIIYLSEDEQYKEILNQDEISRIIDTIFRITYILHKPFTNQSYDEFLNAFDFSIISDVKALEELARVIGDLLGTIKKPTYTP